MASPESLSCDVEPDATALEPDDESVEDSWWASTGLLKVISAAMAALTLIWVAVALVTAGRGFDLTDEGGYLLSYRWWSENYRTFTGSQYLYGPIYELLGYDIAGLRIVRLLSILVSTAIFGWSFMRWLRLRRPDAPKSRFWELAGTLTIVAGGGMAYSWLPLSPGYNDVSMLGSLLVAAALLRFAADVDRSVRTPILVPILVGTVMVEMILSKWTSSLFVLFIAAIVTLFILRLSGLVSILRIIGWVLVGVVGTLVFIQFLVAPLTETVPLMLATNKLVAAAANSPSALLSLYTETAITLLTTVVKTHFLLLAAGVVVVVCRGEIARKVAAGYLAVAVAFSVLRVIIGDGLTGGAANLPNSSATVITLVITSLILAITIVIYHRLTRESTDDAARATAEHPAHDNPEPEESPQLAHDSGRTWLVIGFLVALPILQGAGTGNPLYFMAINCFAAWAAVIVFVVTGTRAAPVAAQALAITMAVLAAVCACAIASTSLWDHPYRTAPTGEATSVAAGVTALDSLKLSPQQASEYSTLHAKLAPFITPGGRYFMAFDELPGLVLAMDGRPVGEAWYSQIDPGRTAANIKAECANGNRPWGARPPILIFNRQVTANELGALESCGLNFEKDYRLLAPAETTLGLGVYVPTREVPKATIGPEKKASGL